MNQTKNVKGIMSELLIQRIINRDKIFQLLKAYQNEENLIATDDERFLSSMYDVKDLSYIELEVHFIEYRSYFMDNDKLEKNIRAAFSSGKRAIHKIFKSDIFVNDLSEFLSDKSNRELRTNCIWNVALFCIQITQNMYRPVINTFFDAFNQDMAQLHENVDTFADIYLRNSQVEFETSFQITSIFSPDEKKKLNTKNLLMSICGRIDMYKPVSGDLIEIKASIMDECAQSWIIQAIFYALLLDTYSCGKVQKIYVVNILQGYYFYIQFHVGKKKASMIEINFYLKAVCGKWKLNELPSL